MRHHGDELLKPQHRDIGVDRGRLTCGVVGVEAVDDNLVELAGQHKTDTLVGGPPCPYSIDVGGIAKCAVQPGGLCTEPFDGVAVDRNSSCALQLFAVLNLALNDRGPKRLNSGDVGNQVEHRPLGAMLNTSYQIAFSGNCQAFGCLTEVCDLGRSIHRGTYFLKNR